MWFPEPAANDDPLSIFMVQAWNELNDSSAPDTYQARATNIVILLDDLLHVLELVEQEPKWKTNIQLIADEIEESFKHELDLFTQDHELTTLMSLITGGEDVGTTAMRNRVQIAKSLIGNFGQRLISDLRATVAAHPNKKGRIHQRLGTISTIIHYNNGWSEIENLSCNMLAAKSPLEICDAIADLLNSGNRQYICTLAITGDKGVVAGVLSGGDIRRPQGKRINRLKDDVKIAQWLEQHKEDALVTASTSASSASQAAHQVSQRVNEILNIHNLIANVATYRAHTSLVVELEDKHAVLLEVTPGKHFGLSLRSDATKITLKRLRALGPRMGQNLRLSNALESHRLALSASDPRTAIINLWTALETICGPTSSGSIGTHVANTIAPIVAWRRIDKIVGYTAICVHDLIKRRRLQIPAELVHSTKHKVAREDILAALTGADENPTAMAIMGLSDDAQLLRIRIDQAFKSFGAAKDMRNSLVKSHDRIVWQIHRIYRARNLLVHQGEQSHLIWRLLQNAQYYTSLVISRVMHDMSLNERWTIDTALESEKLRYQHLITSLQRNHKQVKYDDLIVKRCTNPERPVW